MLNFSGIDNRTRFGRILRLPLRLVPRWAVVPILQGPARGCWWVAGSTNHGAWLGSYELEKQRFFASELRPGSVVWDVGANVGIYTLLASRVVGPTGRVVAIEPVPRNIEFLGRHLALNKLANVEIVAAAAGETDGVAQFRLGENHSMGAVVRDGEMSVPCIRLDSLLARNPAVTPAVIKLDIEGGEAGALRGATALLATHRPTIFLATHGEESCSCCRQILAEAGYNFTPLADPLQTDSASCDEFIARPR